MAITGYCHHGMIRRRSRYDQESDREGKADNEMMKEIRDKVEAKRQEIMKESERLRTEATKNHICANCGSPLPSGKRTYCSSKCSVEFSSRFDYSVSSNILREYARKLKDEYNAAHPKKERQPWSTPVARTEHECSFCGSMIKIGEKHEKYVRLPEHDEWFDDDPYGVLRYHTNCLKFVELLSDAELIDYEGFDGEEAFALLCEVALETGRTFEETVSAIVSGNFPSTVLLEKISNEYDGGLSLCYLWDSDHSGYRYVYAVKYESFNRSEARMHVSLSEIKDPSDFFAKYYSGINGDEFNRILSVKWIKVPLPRVEEEETLK